MIKSDDNLLQKWAELLMIISAIKLFPFSLKFLNVFIFI